MMNIIEKSGVIFYFIFSFGGVKRIVKIVLFGFWLIGCACYSDRGQNNNLQFYTLSKRDKSPKKI